MNDIFATGCSVTSTETCHTDRSIIEKEKESTIPITVMYSGRVVEIVELLYYWSDTLREVVSSNPAQGRCSRIQY